MNKTAFLPVFVLSALLKLSVFMPQAIAQTAANLPANAVQEAEMKSCLLAEQEGLKRFKALEERATELRTIEGQLTSQRQALETQRAKMNKGKPDTTSVNQFNNQVNDYNERSDRLNAEKQDFEAIKTKYSTWLNDTLKPACDPLANRPVPAMVSFYACQFDQPQPLTEVPYCENLEKVDALKACVAKAASKAEAMNQCAAL